MPWLSPSVFGIPSSHTKGTEELEPSALHEELFHLLKSHPLSEIVNKVRRSQADCRKHQQTRQLYMFNVIFQPPSFLKRWKILHATLHPSPSTCKWNVTFHSFEKITQESCGTLVSCKLISHVSGWSWNTEQALKLAARQNSTISYLPIFRWAVVTIHFQTVSTYCKIIT